MPSCDGPTAIAAIREYYLNQGILRDRQPFICCLSAYSEKSFKDVSLNAGADCFQTKPIFQKTLHKVLI